VAADGGSDGPQVVLVGTDHQVMSAEGAFNYARVHDVASRSVSGERADRAGLAVVERLDITPGQNPGQQSLAAAAAPGLRQHWRGDGGHLAERQQGAVTGPHAAFSPVSGDERAGVVGDAHSCGPALGAAASPRGPLDRRGRPLLGLGKLFGGKRSVVLLELADSG